MSRSRPLAATFLVGVLVLVGGVAVALRQRTMDFGWFAYAPMGDDEVRVPSFVSTPELLAWGAAVVGLVLVAGCAGFALGARAGRRSAH